jgi:hypothetical protein
MDGLFYLSSLKENRHFDRSGEIRFFSDSSPWPLLQSLLSFQSPQTD